jgi:hypothetical protein
MAQPVTVDTVLEGATAKDLEIIRALLSDDDLRRLCGHMSDEVLWVADTFLRHVGYSKKANAYKSAESKSLIEHELGLRDAVGLAEIEGMPVINPLPADTPVIPHTTAKIRYMTTRNILVWINEARTEAAANIRLALWWLFATVDRQYMECRLKATEQRVAEKDTELRELRDVKKASMKRARTARYAVKAVCMPEKAKDREVFKVFVRPSDHLLVPVRRKLTSMPSREKELIDAGFVATDEIADVPNARYFWQDAVKAMRRQGVVSVRYVSHPSKKNKNLRVYDMTTDFCLNPILAEIGGEEDEIKWLRVVTSSAGRVPTSQKLMDDYMRPRKTGQM